VLRPPRERPTACFFSPFPPDAARYALTCAESIVCMSADRPHRANSRKRLPRARDAPSARSGCRSSSADTRTGNRTSGKALENTHDTADDATIINPLDAANIGRQVRLDPRPPLLAQPKQVPAHGPDPLPKTNQDPNVRPRQLLCSDPSQFPRWFGRLPRCRVSSGRTVSGEWNLPRSACRADRLTQQDAGRAPQC
jgi:hypothetical protein